MSQFREELSAPGLWLAIKDYFFKIGDHRTEHGNKEIPLSSALLSACAMFALKFPSLLQFDEHQADPAIVHNLKSLFFIKQVPSDTQMREILDQVEPESLLNAFDVIFAKAQRGKVLENFSYLEDGYFLSLDANGYFDSYEVHCHSCCSKLKKDGKLAYYHQFLPVVLVSPDQKQLIPMGAEPIVQQERFQNDCEQKAAKRILKRIRDHHPKLKLIVVQDGLHSKGPHLKFIREQKMDFIITAKQSDHRALFDQIRMYDEFKEVDHLELEDDEFRHRFRYKNDVLLNGASDQRVNFLEYWETSKKKGRTQHWSWVTSIKITQKNIYKLMKGARARWKIENEVFNTLKNQGYQLEHNFGHGSKYLSTNFALLMLLAFAVDQLQEHCCKVFQKAREIWKSRILLWEKMRSKFYTFLFKN